MACAQKAMLRGVSLASRPYRDLNHCRSESIKLISAIGVPQTYAASWVRSSNDCSGSVSRILYCRSDANRSLSSAGTGLPILSPCRPDDNPPRDESNHLCFWTEYLHPSNSPIRLGMQITARSP